MQTKVSLEEQNLWLVFCVLAQENSNCITTSFFLKEHLTSEDLKVSLRKWCAVNLDSQISICETGVNMQVFLFYFIAWFYFNDLIYLVSSAPFKVLCVQIWITLKRTENRHVQKRVVWWDNYNIQSAYSCNETVIGKKKQVLNFSAYVWLLTSLDDFYKMYT